MLDKIQRHAVDPISDPRRYRADPQCPPPDLDFATCSFRLSTRYDQSHSPALLELLGCHPVRIWRIAGTHVPFLLVVRILRTNAPGGGKVHAAWLPNGLGPIFHDCKIEIRGVFRNPLELYGSE